MGNLGKTQVGGTFASRLQTVKVDSYTLRRQNEAVREAHVSRVPRSASAFYWGGLSGVCVSGRIGVIQIAELTGPCKLKESAQLRYLGDVVPSMPGCAAGN